MATGPWDSFKTQQAETSEPQEQGPWTQFAEEKPAADGAPWEKFQGESGFIPSVMRGGRGIASLATDIIPAMVGKATGNDEYAKQQLEEAGAYQKETERMYPAEVASYKDIHGAGDALTYIKESIGEAIPSMIPSLFTGGAAGFAVRGATNAAMQAAEQTAAKEVAKAAAKNILTQESLDGIRKTAIDAGVKEAQKIALKAQAVGAVAGSAAQNIPDVYQNIYEATGKQDLGAALAFGSFNAALDAITPINLMRKASKAGIGPEEIAAAWYKRAGKGAAEGFVSEGGTEALQEISSAAAEKFVDENQQFFSEKNFERFINAGLKGGAGGAGITSATNVAFGKGPEKQAAPEGQQAPVQETQETTTEAPPVQDVDTRVQKRAEELQTHGLEADDALKLATKNIADEDAKAQTPEDTAAVADVVADPARVEELVPALKQQFGLTDQEAQESAVQLATEEAKEDALAQVPTTGAENAGQSIDGTSGVSPELVGQPDQIESAAGVGEPTTDGVVPAGENVAPAATGETEQPAALTEPITETPQGEPLGTETPEAVQTETQGQEPAPAAEVTEQTPAEEITPQQIAEELIATEEPETEAATAEEATPVEEAAPVAKPTKASKKAQDKANLKEVEDLEAKFARVGRPLTDKEIESMRAAREVATGANPEHLTDLVREHRLDKVRTINEILDMRERMKTASPEVKARLNDLINSPLISQQEYNDVVRGRALKAKYSAQLKAAQAPVDTGFNAVTNGAQAIARILKTGTMFEKMLAKRISAFVRNVKFVVVEKGQEPEALSKPKAAAFWKDASGLFVENEATGERTIYVAGESYGERQGINNITVLHELLHAATNQKLYLGIKALENGFSRDAALTKATKDMRDVMHNVQEFFLEQHRQGKLPAEMMELYRNTNGTVLTDLREFLAYGMSDPDFQDFMMQVEGMEQDVSFFSRFVDAIRRFFGMDEDTTNALTDLVIATDKLLSAQKTADMRLLEKGDRALAQRTMSEGKVSAQVQHVSKSTQKNIDKLKKSSFADNLRDSFPALAALRGQTPIADELALRTKDFKLGALKQLLPTLQTETLVQWASRIQVGKERGIPGIAQSWQAMGDMIAMRTKLTNAMTKINGQLSAIAEKSPEQYKKLADVMHLSTLLSKDPATNQTNAALNRMWGELTAPNQKLYEEVRDFYKNNHELYHALLDEQLEASTLPPEAKSKLMASIKKMYEDGKKLYPYFPLMRYGQFWVRVGKGKEGEFHMFESAIDRDRFVMERVRQMNQEGDTRSREQMIEDLYLDEGNDLTSARRKDDSASDMLKQIFNTIDSTSKEDIKVEALKDEIYQLYLQTLPDRNFRRQYLKRQGKAGFSGDIQRNFINAGTNTANQLARIKYGPRVMDQIERAEQSLQGNPDKARLGEFVSEMRIRAEMQVRPSAENGAAFAAAKLLNTSAFLWMMTSIKTMVAQFTSVPIFVAPVLISKHGMAKTAAAFGRSLNVFNNVGKFGKDGNYNVLGMLGATGMDADEKAAIQYMVDRGLSDNTMAYDMGNRRDISTAAYSNPVRKTMRQVSNAMTAMFHHAERLIREVTFMTSYRLHRDAGKTHEQSLRLAEAESHEALNNYHASNRPRGILAKADREVVLNAHKPLGRAVLQFKMYPAFVTTYFVRNFYRMTKDLDPAVRKEARIQFLGSLMTSFALAGTVGIPGISLAMGIAQGLLNALRGDDDDDELEQRNLEFWFRNKWLPDTFGGVKIGGKGLDEILDRGVITAMTGYDITSSLSMNNMWFPEQKDQSTVAGEMQSFLLSLAGPGASLGTTQIPKAIDYFNQGKILQGMEQLSPALFRSGLTAARYSQEGATTASGAVIKDADEFTTGQLLAQSAGFVTEGLQAKREAIFKLQGEIMKVRQERSKLLNRLDLEINQGSDEAVEKVFDNIIKFNSHNPMDSIGAEQLQASLKKQMERRLNSDRGFPLDKKYYPYLMDLLEPSSVKLDREAKK